MLEKAEEVSAIDSWWTLICFQVNVKDGEL